MATSWRCTIAPVETIGDAAADRWVKTWLASVCLNGRDHFSPRFNTRREARDWARDVRLGVITFSSDDNP